MRIDTKGINESSIVKIGASFIEVGRTLRALSELIRSQQERLPTGLMTEAHIAWCLSVAPIDEAGSSPTSVARFVRQVDEIYTRVVCYFDNHGGDDELFNEVSGPIQESAQTMREAAFAFVDSVRATYPEHMR